MIGPTAVVEMEGRPVDRAASAHSAPEAEAVYDELLDHAHRCNDHCRAWEDALWRADRLCPVGAALVAKYARVVCGLPARLEVATDADGDLIQVALWPA